MEKLSDAPARQASKKQRRSSKVLSILANILLAAAILLSSACGQALPIVNKTATPAPTPTDRLLADIDPNSKLAPQVIGQQPKGGQELARDGQVVLTFDQAMDPKATRDAWQMSDSKGRAVEGKISWLNSRTFSFHPVQALQPGAIYQASLSEKAANEQGVPLSKPVKFSFQTVGDLQVSQVFPADGAADVENSAVITAIFNRPVVPLGVAADQSKLPDPLEISPALPGKGEWVSTSVYAFHADGPLKGSTTYIVMIKAGLPDAAQETQLPGDYIWKFTTVQPRIANLALPGGPQDPQSQTTGIRLDQVFSISFFQPMDPASTLSALSLTSKNGEPVSLTTNWKDKDTTLEITPTQRLALGTDYLLKLDPSAQSADGGSLQDGLNWSFTTVPPPSVQYISPPEGPAQGGFNPTLQVKFASPMNIESVKANLSISPKPDEPVEWYYNEYDNSLNAYILKPSTAYEVRALPGMMDIYGNPLVKEHAVRFTTPPYDPSAGLQMPYNPSVFRSGGAAPQEFYATYRNVRSVSFKLFKISPQTFDSLYSGKQDQFRFNPPESDLVWQHQEQSAGKRNERVLKAFQPAAANGDPLPVGIYFLGMNADPEIPHDSTYLDVRMFIVANANLTFKTNSNEALMWLTGLTSGKPLPGVPLTVYDSSFKPIAQGTTDQDGLLKASLPAQSDPYQRRYALSGGDVFSFASSDWGSGANLSDYGMWGGYYAPANQPKAYVYTDRPIYRPGQPVYFKGIVRLDDDLAYSLPDQSQVSVRISDYQETVYQADLPLSKFGSFDGHIQLDPEAALGAYTLEVGFPGAFQASSKTEGNAPDQAAPVQNAFGSVSFNVAEYHKPEFKVDVQASPKDLLAGQDFQAAVTATYYSGGTVQNARVDWTLRADPYLFDPAGLEGATKGISGYAFNDYQSDAGLPNQPGAPNSQVVAQGQGQTDANGQFLLTLPAELAGSKTDLRFTFEATLQDISQNAVTGRAEVTAHRSGVYVGAKPASYVGTAGKEQIFDLIAVGWDGKPIPGQKMKVDVVERRWHSVQQQDATGRIQWTSQVEDVPVASFSDVVADDKGQAAVRFTPPNGGIFSARVSALDSSGHEATTAGYLWVAGDEYIPWRQTNDHSFDLVADSSSYAPGDTAKILIASPFEGQAYALITVERGRIHDQKVVLLDSNSTVYPLPITADMAPNAYVSVVVVKGVDETNPRPNYKMGVVEIKVEPREQALTVEVTPDKPQAGPGDTVNYTVRTLNYQGQPVSSELSLGLSDLATLSLTGPNSSPIMDYFYDHRTLGVWTSIPLGQSIEEYNAAITEQMNEGRGMGSGGGKGEGDFGVVEVRQNFPDTAFWDAHVETGENGQASVSVTLPDNLTTWRMDARAITLDTRVGQATLDLISSKPLLVSPQTPRFFVLGDRARLGAAVHNNTNGALTVNVTLEAEGVTLQGEVAQQVQIPAQSQAYVSWEAAVDPEVQRVDLVFRAASTDGVYTDASRPPQGTLENQGIPVYRFEAPETVGTSGELTSGGSRTEAITLPAGVPVTGGTLTVETSPSLAASMTDSLTYLEHYPYECVEQTVSRFLPNVITTRAMKSAGIFDPSLESNLQTQVTLALQRLYNWQNPNGGWGWWPSISTDTEKKSDPLTSAYVVLGLVEARDAGYLISQDVLDRALDYLRTQIVFFPQPGDSARPPETYQLNRQAFLLYVLARAGQPDPSNTVRLYENRQALAVYARAYLAQALSIVDSGDPRLKTLLSDLASSAVVTAAGTHWEEPNADPWNWNTDNRTTAIVLSVLSQLDPGNPINANAVRWLMSSRTEGHWQGTQETAWALMALTNWMAASGELSANYQYAVALNGARLGGGQADAGTLRQTQKLQVQVSSLLKDQANRLVFARDDGPGTLYYTAYLNLSLPVDQLQPLDQGITVSRSYYRPEDPNTPVTQAKVGDLLYVRVTVVAPHDLNYAIVNDPLPAGLEAVDQSLNTSPQNTAPQSYQWDDLFTRGWGWWYFDHVQLHDEKVELSASYLPAGTYVYAYMARASTAGTFQTIPTTAQEFYFPEVYGRGAGSAFTVNP